MDVRWQTDLDEIAFIALTGVKVDHIRAMAGLSCLGLDPCDLPGAAPECGVIARVNRPSAALCPPMSVCGQLWTHRRHDGGLLGEWWNRCHEVSDE
jgi:hypothetical protein